MIIDPYTWHRLTIQHIEQTAKDTLSIYVARPADYRFRAGQYAVVRVASEKSSWLRQYSFASAPGEDRIELLIQRAPGGTVTTWFFETAKVGDVLELSEAFGNFVRENTSQHATYIAGKVGVAPFLSMIRTDAKNCQLLYCVREKSEICHQKICESAAAHYFVSSENSRMTTSDLKRIVQRHELVYLCGSKAFVDATERSLKELGLPTELLRKELFTLE